MYIEKLKIARYGWCSVGAGRHFRLLEVTCDKGEACADCRNYLINLGYRHREKEKEKVEVNSEPVAPVMEPKTKAKRKSKKEPMREILRREVKEVLGRGEVCTNQELFKKVKATSSQACLDLLLWNMRKNGELIGKKLPEDGRLVYTLPGMENLIVEQRGIFHEDKVLDLLSEGELTVAQIAARLNRRRPTVARWIDHLEQIGEITTRVKVKRGQPGRHKFCRRRRKRKCNHQQAC